MVRAMRWRAPNMAMALLVSVLATSLPSQEAAAGPLRDRLAERRAERQAQKEAQEARGVDGIEDEDGAAPATLPVGVRLVRDVSYGADPQQRFDVYSNGRTKDAPVIFMVHGGGWRLGSKSASSVVTHKVARWVPKGFVFVSVGYRLLPQADPLEQARDVARALAAAQQQAANWGGDRSRFILMGHSAGAHLVALLATAPALAAGVEHPPQPWLGTVALDSAAFNVVEIMEHRHLRLYDNAFGSDHEYWKSASPFFSVTRASRPILAVCSSRREDSCRQAHQFATKAAALGVTTTVLEKDFSHRDINQRLGEEPRYTGEVEAFLGRLDKGAAQLLAEPPRDSR